MPSPSKLQRWIFALLLSLVTASAVSATSYICAWQEYRDWWAFRTQLDFTRADLNQIVDEISKYRDATGKLPASLDEVQRFNAQKYPVSYLRLEDAWSRPFHYEVKGDTYDLFSYGRDDKPGGTGLDADIHAGQEKSEAEKLTLWQFAEVETGGMRDSCLLAGAVAFPICLLAGLNYRGSQKSLLAILIGSAVTALFAIWTAVEISAVHIPSGH